MDLEKTIEKKSDSEITRSVTVEEGVTRLKKRYNFTTLLTLAVATSASWESIIASLYQAIVLGGPTTLFYSFFISCSATLLIACSLGELISIWPNPAGQVHWTVHLAPNGLRRAWGWCASWILLFYYAVGALTALYAGANQITSLAVLAYPDFVPERWQIFLMATCIMLIGLLVNIFSPRSLHYLSIFATALHFLGYFGISITLLATTKHFNPPSLVFASIQNQSGWKSDGLALLIGTLPTLFGFLAIDAPVRYAEEVENAEIVVPRAVVWAVVLNSCLALPFVVVLGFTMGSPEELLTSPIIALNPLAQILVNSTGSNTASYSLCSLIVGVSFVSSISLIGGLGRCIMAQGRDLGIPFANYCAHISQHFNVPINGLCLGAAIQIAISVIYIGNSTAFYGIASGMITLQILSFLMPISLRTIGRVQITPGPWNLGKMSKPINIAAVLGYVFLFVIMCFPMAMPVNATSMNYAIVITGGVVLFSTVLYFTWGKKNFRLMSWEDNSSDAVQCPSVE